MFLPSPRIDEPCKCHWPGRATRQERAMRPALPPCLTWCTAPERSRTLAGKPWSRNSTSCRCRRQSSSSSRRLACRIRDPSSSFFPPLHCLAGAEPSPLLRLQRSSFVLPQPSAQQRRKLGQEGEVVLLHLTEVNGKSLLDLLKGYLLAQSFELLHEVH